MAKVSNKRTAIRLQRVALQVVLGDVKGIPLTSDAASAYRYSATMMMEVAEKALMMAEVRQDEWDDRDAD